MFFNINKFNFGITQTNLTIDNVNLPPWAKSNPYLFTINLRKSF